MSMGIEMPSHGSPDENPSQDYAATVMLECTWRPSHQPDRHIFRYVQRPFVKVWCDFEPVVSCRPLSLGQIPVAVTVVLGKLFSEVIPTNRAVFLYTGGRVYRHPAVQFGSVISNWPRRGTVKFSVRRSVVVAGCKRDSFQVTFRISAESGVDFRDGR